MAGSCCVLCSLLYLGLDCVSNLAAFSFRLGVGEHEVWLDCVSNQGACSGGCSVEKSTMRLGLSAT